MRVVICLFMTAVLSQLSVEGKHWAVIVAGSNTWMNYRHQADVCHAYQVLHNHGIPDENIVVLMYDDIANNVMNRYHGKIINKPNGPDVYHGVPKDYTGKDVTPDVFLNVLQGNKDALPSTGSGKYVDSGPNDNIFVYFSDHGAPNLIAFPNDELHSHTLNEAIQNMYNNKRYNKMVFYIESCESGSMFQKLLPNNINVYATTASSPTESSYAFYYDKILQTYLGDLYSVRWMEDSDKGNFLTETLEEQYLIVKKETNLSHVHQYGDNSIASLTLSNFQGDGKTAFGNLTKLTPDVSAKDAVPAPEVPMQILFNMLDEATSEEERVEIIQKIRELKKVRKIMEETVHTIVASFTMSKEKREKILTAPAITTQYKCYEAAVDKFRSNCFDFNKHEYALRHLYVLSNLCDEGFRTVDITVAIENSCAPLHEAYV